MIKRSFNPGDERTAVKSATAESPGKQSARVANENRWDDDGGHVASPPTAFVHAIPHKPFWSVMTTLDIGVKSGLSC